MRTMTVYRFEELQGKARERALEWGREQDGLWDADQMTDLLKDELAEVYGIGDGIGVEVHWSLGYCQGEGVTFKSSLDLDAMAKKDEKLKGILEQFETVRVLAEWPEPEFWASVNHSGSVELQALYHDAPEPAKEFYDQSLTSLEEYLRERVKEISRKLEEYRYSNIEYWHSDEHVAEWLEGNEFEFDEEGEPV